MGIMAHKMAMANKNFLPGDGVVGQTPSKTVQSIGFLAKEGLRDIDKLILDVMYSSIHNQ